MLVRRDRRLGARAGRRNRQVPRRSPQLCSRLAGDWSRARRGSSYAAFLKSPICASKARPNADRAVQRST
jgi:hypothetical protein